MEKLKNTAKNYGKKAKSKDALIFMCVGAVALVAIYFLFDFIISIITMNSLEEWYYVFSILGVFATLAAVIVAIRIPKTIADRQDKIALFDKRYELLFQYEILLINAHQAVFAMSNIKDSFGSGNMELWVAFIDFLMPEKGIISELKSNNTMTSDQQIQHIQHIHNFVSTQIKLYNLQLDKISYLFDLCVADVEKLQQIKKNLDSSAPHNFESGLPFQDLMVKYKEIAQLIIDSEFDQIMKEQLRL